jgi:DNA-binding transcriptional LysR family regulator
MLSPRVPELAALQMLATVARTGSLRSAAAELGVSQQALSSRVRALEARVGIPLINRTARGSRLTPAGVLIEQWAARVLDAAAELDAGLAALRTDRSGHVRVAASLTVAEHLMPRWMVALRDQQLRSGAAVTNVDLDAVNSRAVAELVRSGQVDLGFVEGPAAPSGLRSRVVAHDELYVVIGIGHPWQRRRAPLLPAELAATSFVARESGSGTRDAFESALAAALPAGMPIAAPVLELASTAAVKAAVIAGSGPAALSSLAVADDLLLGRVQLVATQGLRLRRPLRAVWVGGGSPPAGAVRDLIAVAQRS